MNVRNAFHSLTVNMCPEDLGTARAPIRGGLDRAPVEHHERIRQRVGRNDGLVVVRNVIRLLREAQREAFRHAADDRLIGRCLRRRAAGPAGCCGRRGGRLSGRDDDAHQTQGDERGWDQAHAHLLKDGMRGE